MFIQSKKSQQWKTANYVVTILNFVIYSLVMFALALGVILVNAGSIEAFVDYIVKPENVIKLSYVGVFIFILNAGIYVYLFFEFRDFLISAKNVLMVFTVIVLSYVLSFVLGNYVNIYARPIALCALVILLLVNKRTALFINFMFALYVFFLDVFTNQSIYIDTFHATASLIMAETISIFAIYLVDGKDSRIKVFVMGLIISVPISVCALAIELSFLSDVYRVLSVILFSFTGGIASVVVMMALLPIMESAFNLLTNYRLAEITDHKSKLIKKLIDEAGGTFNHSMVVATLAETSAAAIEENPILARAAAYYHDIGKLKQPQYFTENQHGYNPHDDLTPELSTEIIRSHTKDGYELIKKYHLPLILADVAREHHGTLPIQAFYAKALKYTDGGELDIADFCYPGPKPHSKIAAIIMLCDGCEAAVRAHNDRSREKVEKIVGSIFDDRMRKEQFSECDVTMRELDVIKESIINSLSGVYHDRVKYPKITNKKGNAFSSQGAQDKQ